MAEPILWNGCALADEARRLERSTRDNLNEFLGLRMRLSAKPVVGVFYMREAYECDGLERVRVTFDRELHYGILGSPVKGRHDMWWPVRLPGVILEIKFTNTFPFWVADFIRRGELIRRGVCKYKLCAQEAGIVNEVLSA
jgi:hypothetical protein